MPWRSGLVYLVASLGLFHGVVAHPRTVAPQGGTGDVAQMAWFLQSAAQSLTHGRNPLVTQLIHAPSGVNLMWNTSMPLLGVVAAPVTLLGGPLLAVNVLFVLAPVLTSLATRWWLRAHVSPWGAAVGGAALGFGPYVAAHLGGHLNLVFLPLVPVILRLGEDVVVRRKGRGHAIALGVAMAAQFLLSEEVLLLTLLGAAAAMLAFRLRPTWGLVAAVGTSAVLTAVPVLVQVAGPQRVRGVNPYRYYAEPRDVVVPSDHLALGLSSETGRLVSRGSSAFEDSVYLGVPLLVLAVVAAVRIPKTRVPLAIAALALVLTTGKGEHRGWAGLAHPLALLLSPPVLSSIVATRFSLVIGVVLAFVLAVVADRRYWPWTLGLVLVAVSWVPAPPAQSSVHVPAYFTQQHLSLQGPVLLLPAPPGGADRAMLYQAMSGLRFAMTDSYALERGPDGRPASYAVEDPITWLARRPPTAAAVAAARTLPLPRTVLLVVRDDRSGRLRRAAELLLGPPVASQGVLVWSS